MSKQDGKCDGYDCPYTGYYTIPGHKDKLYCHPHRTSLLLDLSEKEVKKLKKNLQGFQRTKEIATSALRLLTDSVKLAKQRCACTEAPIRTCGKCCSLETFASEAVRLKGLL